MSDHRIKNIDSIGPIHHSDSMPKKVIFGYTEQMKAGLVLGSIVAKGNFKSALIFGYPRNGKEAFPLALTNELNNRSIANFSFIKIHCERILAELRTPQEVHHVLSKLSKEILKSKPIVLAIDELEVLSNEQASINSVSFALLKWVLTLLNQESAGIFVIGISNNPEIIDKSLLAKFCVTLYFDFTSEETAYEITKHYFGKSRYKEIASKLFSQLKALNFYPLSSELINAYSKLNEFDLKTLSTDEIVSLIRRNLTPCASIEAVTKYRNENTRLIKYSTEHMIPYWSHMPVRV